MSNSVRGEGLYVALWSSNQPPRMQPWTSVVGSNIVLPCTDLDAKKILWVSFCPCCMIAYADCIRLTIPESFYVKRKV
jgi:hypothetical protein